MNARGRPQVAPTCDFSFHGKRLFSGRRGADPYPGFVRFAVAVCVRYKRLLQDSRGRLSLQFYVRFAVAVAFAGEARTEGRLPCVKGAVSEAD